MPETEPYVLDLTDVIRLSDDELLRVCAANPDLRIEQNAAGQLEIMPPAGLGSSARGAGLLIALGIWNQESTDGIVLDSSAGFRLPNGALRSPDVSWLRREVWERFTPAEREKFIHVVPDFLVEIRSPTDGLSYARGKMAEWMENGCRLGWLIDPMERRVHVFRAGGRDEIVDFETELSGEDVLPGFTFDPRSLP